LVYRRYVIAEILKSAGAVFLLVVAVYSCDCAIVYLDETLSLSLPAALAGLLVLLRIAIALEVILPVTLFLAILIALGRLYRDSEMTAFCACGLGVPHVLRVVVLLAVPVALVTAFTSLVVRPAGWTRIYHILDEAQAQFDISRLSPKTFLEVRSGQAVFFVEEVYAGEGRAEGVFVRVADADGWKIIRAREMRQSGDAGGARALIFQDGTLYEPPLRGGPWKISRFQQARYPVPDEAPEGTRYRRKATPTGQLVGSARLEDIAELQWRLSAPLSVLLLSVLAVPLSKSNPRKGKFARVGIAIVIFAIYFQLFVLARTWVDDGTVTPLPGIWWVPLLLAGTTLWLLGRSGDMCSPRWKRPPAG
jgi:lipopolysaccharide export system permease protein